MEDNAQEASKNVDRAEEDVSASLATQIPTYTTLEPRLAKFRSACQDYILNDFAAALEAKVESRLWDAHSRVNQKFRTLLTQFRDGEGKKKPVERRKAEKLYLEFIKSSTRFYRGYIQGLASNFSNIPEIVEVARRFNLDTLSADKPLSADLKLKEQLVRSCYATLIHLGDLSRYRETELQTQRRNWGPAKGYYDLASALDPSSGTSNNQLAVIAFTDQDHLRGVYHLYRAVCVESPHPLAEGNLKLEFKKIMRKSSQGKPILDEGVVVDGNRALQTRFLLFHARCFLEEFVGYEDQQNKILCALVDELRERPYDTMIRKLCLINISAQHLAAKRMNDDLSASSSFEIAQHMNITTFSALLQLLRDELQPLGTDTDSSPSRRRGSSMGMTPVTRRILPHLRLYSGWLLSTVQQLLANRSLEVQIAALWQVYAEVLSLLSHTFPVIRRLPELPYLLDEDQDTLAFLPFSDFVKSTRFRDAKHRLKPLHDEAAFGPRSSEDEMLYRVKCLVKDGVYLCKKDVFGLAPIPLTFANNRFMFCDDTRGHEKHALTPSLHAARSSATGVGRDNGLEIGQPGNTVNGPATLHQTISDAEVSEFMSSAMEDMVNNLIQADTNEPTRSSVATSDRPSARIAHQVSKKGQSPLQPATVTARDLVQKVRHPSVVLPNEPVISNIWGPHFSPQPGATRASSSRPSTAHGLPNPGTASPHSNGSAEFRRMFNQADGETPNRTSPVQSFPTSGIETLPSPQLQSWVSWSDKIHPHLSSLRSSLGADAASPEIVISSPRSAPSPFGAIGEPRPKTGRTPTSGQVR